MVPGKLYMVRYVTGTTIEISLAEIAGPGTETFATLLSGDTVIFLQSAGFWWRVVSAKGVGWLLRGNYLCNYLQEIG